MVDEWHLSQLAGVLTLPFVASFVSITGDTQGLVLFIRYTMAVIQIATAVFLYIRLYKISRMGANVSAITYMLYIPFGIMAMSYNSMAVTALILSLVLILTSEKLLPFQYVLAGLFYAAAVLCCPYLAIVFLLYLLGVTVFAGIRKLKKNMLSPDQHYLHLHGALWITLGTVIAAACFAVFVLSRASVGEIIQSIPLIIDDPEHPPTTLLSVARKIFSGFISVSAIAKYVYIALFVLLVICLADKKRRNRKWVYFPIAVALTVALMVGSFWDAIKYIGIHQSGINAIMWPLNILPVFILPLSANKRIKPIFSTFWVMGMLYAVCLNASSNQGFASTGTASAVSKESPRFVWTAQTGVIYFFTAFQIPPCFHI